MNLKKGNEWMDEWMHAMLSWHWMMSHGGSAEHWNKKQETKRKLFCRVSELWSESISMMCLVIPTFSAPKSITLIFILVLKKNIKQFSPISFVHVSRLTTWKLFNIIFVCVCEFAWRIALWHWRQKLSELKVPWFWLGMVVHGSFFALLLDCFAVWFDFSDLWPFFTVLVSYLCRLFLFHLSSISFFNHFF